MPLQTGSIFYIYICCLWISIYSWDTTTSGFRKQIDNILKFYFQFWFSAFYHHRHVILHWHIKFYLNWTISDRVMMICRFFKMLAIPSQTYFHFPVFYLHTRFRQNILIHGWDITIPLHRSKWSLYWNSTSGFHTDLFTAVSMWFCISLPNYVQIRWSLTELW